MTSITVTGNQPKQTGFLVDCQPGWTLAQGGWGSGKTWVGARKFLIIHVTNNCPGMVVAPTHDGLWLYCVPELERACEEWGLAYSTHPNGRGKQKKPHMVIEGQLVWLFSAEKPAHITGVEVGHVWCEEAARYKADPSNPLMNAPLQIRGRLRHKDARTLHGLVTTTPEGIDTWVQRDFIDEATRKPGHRHWIIPTRGNSALREQYTTDLMGSVPADLVEQYLNGLAVSYVANRAHPTFTKVHHVNDTIAWNDALPGHIGCDYNVSPMCWIAGQVVGDELHVLDEIVIEDFGQVDAAVHLAHSKGIAGTLGKDGALVRPRLVTFHPDKSAKARNTVGDPEFTVMASTAKALRWNFNGDPFGVNPPVDARINLVSRTVRDALGRSRLKVHPRCKHFIENMERTGRGSIGYDPGKNGKLGHILDAFGYWVWDVGQPLGRASSSNVLN